MKIFNPGCVLPEVELVAFERKHSLDLPGDYRNFLLRHNGGVPERRWFPSAKNGQSGFHIKRFFSLDPSARPIDNLEIQMMAARGEGLYDVVPLSFDYGGNKLYLGACPQNSGEILFWDHESGTNRLELISTSFTRLLDSLIEEEESDKAEFEHLGEFGTVEDVKLHLAQGRQLHEKNINGRTLIEEAARFGNVSVMRFCIESGAGICDSLHYAAMNRQREAVDFLLKAGANINALNRFGKTPLAVVLSNDDAFKQYLISLGAKPTSRG
jgi:ankyrin repeat protein